MVELPQEVIKSSRVKTVEVNLPPRTGNLSTSRRTQSNKNSARDLQSPSPQFQSRRMDRKPGESEEQDQSVPQITQLSPGLEEPAPLPSESPAKRASRCSDGEEDDVSNSYTLRLEQTDKKSKEMDFSDSRQYSVASQDGVVQEIQGGFSIDVDEVRANFQRQMKHLA